VDIQTANAQFETGSDVRNIISYAVGVVLLIVAGFGIYNILNMMIYEKLDAIAILKATGFNGADVRRIFLLLSMVIGLVGGVSGLLFGFLMQNLVDSIPFITAALPTVTTFPVDYNPKYYIIAVTFALLTTWIAGLVPRAQGQPSGSSGDHPWEMTSTDPITPNSDGSTAGDPAAPKTSAMSPALDAAGSRGSNILEVRNVSKSFHDPVTVPVLKKVSLEVKRGEFVSITGKSGCGKSTLLYILSTMDTDYEGEVMIDAEPTRGLSGERLARIRNEKIGFVFQFHYLLPEFSVLKNVMLPGLKLGKHSAEEVEHRAMKRLRDLDMHEHALKGANQLSGGQKQRVAIARSLINDPLIIMGDEPTGNLDSRNSGIVFDIFKSISAHHEQSLLVVTHDNDFASRTDRIIEMDDGKVIG
jgi:lipoprotein-releasing system ATP-binding protein